MISATRRVLASTQPRSGAPAAAVYRFGGFELDRARFRLRRGEEPVPLKPRVLDLIGYLVERHGRMVTKRELLRELWGDRFIADGVLTSCVYEARRALGGGDGAEPFIQTVHGRGYRFAAAVETVPDAEPPQDMCPADDATLLLLERLASQLRAMWLLVLATSRDRARGPAPATSGPRSLAGVATADAIEGTAADLP